MKAGFTKNQDFRAASLLLLLVCTGPTPLSAQSTPTAGPEPSGIFASGMEKPGFLDWTSIQNQTFYLGPNAAQINQVAKSAHGSSGMQFMSNTGTPQDNRAGLQETFTSPAAGTTLYFRCYLYLPAGAMKPNSQLSPMVLFSGSSAGLWLQFNTDGNGNISAVQLQGIDGYGGANFINRTNASVPTNVWNYVEFSLQIGTTKANGGGQIWINGISVGSNFATDTTLASSINSIVLGNGSYGGGPNGGMRIYYDDFKMANAGPIGAYPAPIVIAPPSLSFAPLSLTFLAQNTGTTSTAQSLTIQNTGIQAVNFSSALAISGANNTEFAIGASSCPAILTANSSCAAGVTFSPTGAGPRTAKLNFTDNATGSPQSILLSGTGQIPTFTLSLTPANLTFASQTTGTTTTAQTVVIQNTGNSAVTLKSLLLNGADPGDYAVSSNNCPAILAAGGSCAVSLTFSPTMIGIRSASLMVTDNANASPQVVTFTGAGKVVTTYYLDNVNGSDMNNGSSPATPFSTIAKINSLILRPGQTVAFKAGNEWHESLLVGQSGSSSAPITYMAYGTGPRPIISAADSLTGTWMQGSGTAAQEVCSSPCLFSSGFESGSLSDWTSTSVGDTSTTLLTTAAQPNQGLHSLDLATNTSGSNSATYVAKSITAVTSGSSLGVRFYINAKDGAFKPSSSLILVLWEKNGTEAANISFTTDINGNPKYINSYNETGFVNLIPYNTPATGYIVGAWNEIEVDYRAFGANGIGSVYINGMFLGSTGTVNTTTMIGVNEIRIGNFGALAPGAAVNFDDLRLQGSSFPIGSFNGGTPTNVWYHSQMTDPKLINFAGQAGTPVPSVSAITTPNQFFWDGMTTLYVYSVLDPAHIVEVPQRPYALFSRGTSNITIAGLELRGAQMHNVYCGVTLPCINWDFEGDTFNSCYTNDLFFQFDTGVSGFGVTVNNSIFEGSGGSGVAIANGGTLKASITNNQFHDLCKIFVASSPANTTCAAVYGFSQTGNDGTVYVGYNNIHDIGLAQTAAYGSGIHADTVTLWDIEHNTIENTSMAGIEIEKGTGSIARYNLVVNTAKTQYFGGIFVRAGEGLSASSHLVEFNTSYGGYWPCAVGISQNSGMATVTNLTFRKNICVRSTSGTQFYADPGAGNTGNSYINNNFGLPTTDFITFAGTFVGSYLALDQALGYPTGSIQGDPQFVNPSVGNYALLPTSPAIGIGAFP